MWIMVPLIALVITALIIYGISIYRDKTTRRHFERKVIYDESEFYVILANNVPEPENIHKTLGLEKQHAIITDEYVMRVGLFDQEVKKVKSHKRYVEYYIP